MQLKKTFFAYIATASEFFFFNIKTFSVSHKFVYQSKHIFDHFFVMGVESLPIIALASFFVGAITSWTAAYHFGGILPPQFVGSAVGRSVATELGPVLTALIFAGRIGSSTATTISNMQQKEQINALTVLNINPYEYLVVPRLISGIFALPLLVIFANLIAIFGAFVVALLLLNIDAHVFIFGLQSTLLPNDIYFGIIKSFIFGYIILIVGCYYGFISHKWQDSVRVATEKSVVTAAVLILLSNAVMWVLTRM